MMKNKKSNNIYFRLTLFLIGCLSSLSLFANDPVGELMNQGQIAMDSKNYSEAIRLFSEVYNLPVATDGQKRQADSEIAYCRTQMRNAELTQKIQRAENLFSAHKYDDCISYCTNMLATYRSNSKFRNLITRCNDSIAAENNRQMLIEADNLRRQRLSRFQTDLDKSYRYYSTLQYNVAKNIYDSIMNEYHEFKDFLPNWTFRCDSIVEALAKHEAVDWNLIWALNGIQEKGSIKHIGNLSEGYFVIGLNNGAICLLKPNGEWSYFSHTGITNDSWHRFNSGLLGPCDLEDKDGYIFNGHYSSDNRAYLDLRGQVVLKNALNNKLYCGPFFNGYAVSWKYKRDNSKTGLIDTKGQLILPFKYDDIWVLPSGFVCEKGHYIYVLDRNFREIRKFMGTVQYHWYNYPYPYSLNRSLIYNRDGIAVLDKEIDKVLFIAPNLELSFITSLPKKYKYEGAAYSFPFTNGFALVTDNQSWDNFGQRENIIWYFVNELGVKLKNSENHNIFSEFSNGLAPIKRDDDWGIIDQFGNTTFIEDYNKQ